MNKILIYRFSAMGDVTLLLPVIHGLLSSNNDVEVYLLTRTSFFPIFDNINRLHLVEADLKGKHDGLWGLYKLHKEIKESIQPDIIIDLHKVLRTYTLNIFFKLSGFEVHKFSKGTRDKSRAINSKLNIQLISSIERYREALISAGFKVKLANVPLLRSKNNNSILTTFSNSKSIRKTLIGISPFAKHHQKIWGVSKIEKLIQKINDNFELTIFLFGGGSHEILKLNAIAAQYSNCIVSANYFNFSEELSIFPQLSLMLSMDSANMHLASMADIPTLSIWGATHPSLGFYPYQQSADNIIQYNGADLKCRPCSVYGNKKCIHSTLRCMDYISVNQVYEKIAKILKT